MAGFNPSKDQSNGDYTGKLRTVSVLVSNSDNLSPGDMVTLSGTADASGVASVAKAAASVAFTGIIAAVDPIYAGENLSQSGLPASTAGTLKLHVDPNINYVADVANGPLVADDVGSNAPAVVTAATLTGGLMRSNMTVNKTGLATTATLPWRIVQLLTDENGDNLGSRVLVRPNATTTYPGAVGV
jgi:hypothetical protein